MNNMKNVCFAIALCFIFGCGEADRDNRVRRKVAKFMFCRFVKESPKHAQWCLDRLSEGRDQDLLVMIIVENPHLSLEDLERQFTNSISSKYEYLRGCRIDPEVVKAGCTNGSPISWNDH